MKTKKCPECGGELVPYVSAMHADIVRTWVNSTPLDVICDECDCGFSEEELKDSEPESSAGI